MDQNVVEFKRKYLYKWLNMCIFMTTLKNIIRLYGMTTNQSFMKNAIGQAIKVFICFKTHEHCIHKEDEVVL